MNDLHILVVEDEEKMKTLIKTYFIKEGAFVFEASDASSALSIFQNQRIDLIILDIMLNNSDGWSVCRSIRKSSTLPIIILTARNEETDKLFGFELGADDYMTKPFSLKELIARSKSLLKRVSEYNANDAIKYGIITINRMAHRVFLSDNLLDLSPKEYDLLLFFFSNKGLALTRETILNGVWGYDYFGDLRTVDTHIKRLRQKIEPTNYIKTIRGIGYLFEVNDEN